MVGIVLAVVHDIVVALGMVTCSLVVTIVLASMSVGVPYTMGMFGSLVYP